MNKKNNQIQLFVDKLNEDLLDDQTLFNHFKTKPGKQFQKDFSSLTKFAEFTNIIPNIFSIISPILEDFKKRISETEANIPKKLSIEFIDENNEVIGKEIIEVKDLLLDFVEPIKIPQEFEPKIIDMTKRVNSYYFLALHAYIDNYTNSILDLLVRKYCKPISVNYFGKLELKGNSKDKLKSIKNRLIQFPPDDFNKILNGITWSETLSKLFDIRNIFAHVEPKAGLEILVEYFPLIVENTKKEIQSKIKVSIEPNSNLDTKLSNEILEIILPIFHILAVLVKIGNECYGYLALMDLLIYGFLKKN